MLRVAAFFVFLGFVLQPAIAQISSTGVPASALSPTLNNQHTPIPAGATSPQAFPFIVRPFPNFHGRTFQVRTVSPLNPRFRPFGRNHRQFAPQVPVFYPAYPYGAGYDYSMYPSIADPGVDPQADPASAENDAAVAGSEDALRQAYMQGAHDALVQEQRGRQDAHDLMASRSGPKAKSPDSEAKAPEPDNSPSTVFIFKDGRQLETKNYAIMGQTLYDISGTVVKKVPLADLDTEATRKANDDRGITVKLP
jgi:hypothetical protein